MSQMGQAKELLGQRMVEMGPQGMWINHPQMQIPCSYEGDRMDSLVAPSAAHQLSCSRVDLQRAPGREPLGKAFCGLPGEAPVPRRHPEEEREVQPRTGGLELQGYDGPLEGNFTMTNNGHSVQIVLPPTMAVVKGLPGVFTAVQLHLHWGGMNLETSGSEHTMDGMRYIAELHIVHYNSGAYSSFEEAKTKPDGLAVLAFLYEEGHFENTYYSSLFANLPKIRFAGQSTTLISLDVLSMLPENLAYFYRYHGSLTTPPCTENVIWTVFDSPIKLSHTQINLLENALLDWENNTLKNDYRQAQALHDRVVESSFMPKKTEVELCHPETFTSKLDEIQSQLQEMRKYLLDALGKPGHNPDTFQALYFSHRYLEGYAEVHPLKPMALQNFTLCFWSQNLNQGKQTVFSYSTLERDNELVVSVGAEVGVQIGGQSVQFDLHRESEAWVRYCLTWASRSGTVHLWVNGAVGTAKNLQKGYAIQSGGVPVLGKKKNALFDIFEDAFMGWISRVNLWSHRLKKNDIQELTLCQYKDHRKGDVIAWGETPLALFGGVILNADTSCR
ncbi:hypothetical protein JRQ81_009724 [Phrynocephalus forsythii]|uniref:Carbonic anhydrase n=1 Tax=Phrynocephalus forsythii TaxID=171643 RepID=A0A9Q0X9A5_9SAUR|nr:hypothetical protein JRQ81_009724 [Phrynocephalus forsythii]